MNNSFEPRRLKAATPSRALAVVALAAPMLLAATANAQSPCQSPYVLQPGDTIFHVTQQCRVSMNALLEANPGLGNIDDLEVGTQLNIPVSADGGDDDTQGGSAYYTLKPGDTLFSIAQRFGTTVDRLREANSGLDTRDLAVGTQLLLPAGARNGQPQLTERSIYVQPLAGAPGTPVEISGTGYRPGAKVTIGWGPPESEWAALATAEADGNGRVDRTIEIPDAADPGDEIVFVIHAGVGQTAVSRPLDVVDRGDAGGGDSISVTGKFSRGVECPIVTTPSGEVYSLTTNAGDFSDGDFVRVTGETAEASFCMQGEATIDVTSIRKIPPLPRGGVEQTGSLRKDNAE